MTDDSDQPKDNGNAVLKDALAEAQVTVRAYDTKAQIVGVGYILAMGIIARIENLFVKTGDVDLLRIAIAWIVVMVPILLFGFVLYPSRKTAPKVAEDADERVQHVLYVRSSYHPTVSDLKRAARSASYIDELAFEVLSVSGLRDLKRQRFLRALFAAGASFVLLFASQAVRAIAQ
ncbi:MAG: hypothetical protein ACI89J_000864 [Hyphomicrobiaceae bacterium]|jgi:hypothetical protein